MLEPNIRCGGDILCDHGLEQLMIDLLRHGYKVGYRVSYQGRDHSAEIEFIDGSSIDTEDSDGHDCSFAGSFEHVWSGA